MELAIIIYLIGLIDSIQLFSLVALAILGVALLLLHVELGFDKDHHGVKLYKKIVKCLAPIFILAFMLPTEDRAYKMLAAYAGTEVIKMEEAQEIGGKAYKALNKVLDDYLLEEVAK